MRKGYQKVLSKDIGTQFNLVPPFPPVCPSPSLSLSFGVKTVMEMSHFTDNAYRVKIDFSITTTRKEEFSLTQWPIVFLERVVSKLFDQDFSEAVSFLLSGGEFDVPWVTTPGSTVRFLSGYPLGYLGAWPLFALSHHLILWLGGAGYRVLARLDHRRPRRYSRLSRSSWAFGETPSSQTGSWYCLPMSCSRLRNLDISWRYSLLYGWMRQCLNYLKWYHLTALSPWVTLEELFGRSGCLALLEDGRGGRRPRSLLSGSCL
ncbi:hypothetical protein L1987_89458 [Smallanthus sonchifolius]|nr:hypothetical protein L1987_89458 [Smallanthus sonchifolius]